MTTRVYVPGVLTRGEVVTPSIDEARHVTRVLRATVGTAVRVFNGHGVEVDATVETVTKQAVSLRLGEPVLAAPEAGVAITLVLAALKGDKMDDVVRDAVMLGAAALRPVVTARSEVSLAMLARAHRRERWERIAVASAKQCGRAVVPAIEEPASFEQALQAPGLPPRLLMLVEPSASGARRPLRALRDDVPATAAVLVGPEGGWTDAELAAGAERGTLVSLGGRTIRADTMPTVALAALYAIWGEY